MLHVALEKLSTLEFNGLQSELYLSQKHSFYNWELSSSQIPVIIQF